MVKEFNRKIILEDGQEYYGYGFGAHNEKVCEIVFNTSMVGYQYLTRAKVPDRTVQFSCINAVNAGNTKFFHNLR